MFCRKCFYDLRGQVEPRCPECGTPFDPFNRNTVLWERPDPVVQWGKRITVMTVVAVIVALLILFHTLVYFYDGH